MIFDERRTLAIPDDAIQFAVDHWVKCAKEAKNGFHVALSGGSTPKKIYEQLIKQDVDWSTIHLYWSDERAVPSDHPDSNYKMAMEFFSKVPIPKEQIHRMPAEGDIEEGALLYESLIKDVSLDLVMLGMGDDGHTASLFPQTHALHSDDRSAVANFIPKLDTWRMTLTTPCINRAKNIALYVLGENKAKTIHQVLKGPHDPDLLPSQAIGTPTTPALWILDKNAASELKS